MLGAERGRGCEGLGSAGPALAGPQKAAGQEPDRSGEEHEGGSRGVRGGVGWGTEIEMPPGASSCGLVACECGEARPSRMVGSAVAGDALTLGACCSS